MAETEIKRYVVSRDMLTTERNITEPQTKALDATAYREIDGRLNTVESELVTRVVGVKGNAESEYRHGNVNLTPDDLGAVDISEKGEPDGVAELDSNGRVPSSQLPSYVDDIIEGYYDSETGKFYEDEEKTIEIIGEAEKIYVSLDTLKPYRWSGSAFVEIPWGLVLGETANTAYRGDRGKTAYDQSNTNKTNIGRIFKDIAAVEETTTATASHAAGSYILCEGQFYKVTVAIAVGDTIAEGVNVEADTIANALANAGQVTGVKGNAESTYRKGNVNLTLANLGYGSANNLTTTTTGKLLDARQGKVLSDRIGNLTDLETPEKGDLVASINSAQEQLNDHTGVLGAKNLLPNNAISRTINGVTFTVNDDGSVTANGTATDTIRLRINPNISDDAYNSAIPISRGEYILSGGTSNIQLRLYGFADSSASIAGIARNPADSFQSKFAITTDTTRYVMFAYIATNTTVSNEIIYPMLRLASDPDDTYVPYAMTNRELTEKIGKAYSDLATVEPTATASKAYAVKEYLVYNGQLYKVTSAIASGGTITPGTNVTAVKITDEMGAGGHTILNPSGTAVAQREKLQFVGATVTDDETNNKTVVTGNGHKILNSSGTALTQRANLQFKNMNVSDDRTNNKTIVQGQLVKVTQAQYNALSSTQKNDPNVTWEITDAEDAQGISASITVTSSGWSSSTTTVGGVAYYTHETALSSVYDSHPDIFLGATGTFPTTAEKQAYMAVDYITVDASTKKLKCYARTKPTANFVIIVKGVSV